MGTTRGGRLVAEWLKENRRSQEWLAEQIPTHQTSVSAWIRGRQIPIDKALSIRTITGVPIEAWAEHEETASGPSLADDSAAATGTDS